MTEIAPFSYTDDELRSYLPTGWTLAGDPLGRWSSKKKIWSMTIEDTADMPWDVEVAGSEVDQLGRMEALRLSFDRLFRDRLGRRTRGLGF